MSDRDVGLVRLLKPHAKPYLWALLLVVLLGWVSAMLQQSVLLLVSPTWRVVFPSERLSDPALGDEGPDALLAEWRATATRWALGTDGVNVPEDQRMAVLVRLAVIVAVIALLAAVAQFLFAQLSRWAGLRMVVSLRMEVARHLMGLSLRYHGRRRLGDLLSRVSADVNTTLNVINTSLRDLLQEPLLALTALVYALILVPEATLLVIFGLPVLIVPVALLMRRVRRGSKRSLTQLGASVQALSQMFQGIRTVKAFRAEERELERYRSINDGYVKSSMKMVRAMALSRAWTILYTHVGLGLLLLLVGWLAIEGQITSGGDMLVFFLLISRVYSSIKQTTKTWATVEEARGASERLQDLLSETPDIVEASDAREARGLGSGIRFEGVTFAYSDGHGQAISDLDLAIRPGETLALVGPSGAGKSTVVDLLARFHDPTEGRITVDGVELRDLTLDSWTRQYAMVTQEPFLFHATIEENIRYGRPEATLDEIEAAARAANIHDFIAGLPEGYGTNVRDMGTRLSGGQRQRITIARAILRGAPLILLDEATSALDTESEAVVQAALSEMMKGHTAVVIAHRLSTIRNADRIAVLDRGRLVELGTHDELLAAAGHYARLHAAQFAEVS